MKKKNRKKFSLVSVSELAAHGDAAFRLAASATRAFPHVIERGHDMIGNARSGSISRSLRRAWFDSNVVFRTTKAGKMTREMMGPLCRGPPLSPHDSHAAFISPGQSGRLRSSLVTRALADHFQPQARRRSRPRSVGGERPPAHSSIRTPRRGSDGERANALGRNTERLIRRESGALSRVHRVRRIHHASMIGPRWLALLEERCGVPQSSMTAVGNHVELDREHAEEGFAVIDDLVGDPKMLDGDARCTRADDRVLLGSVLRRGGRRERRERRDLRGRRAARRAPCFGCLRAGAARRRSRIRSPRVAFAFVGRVSRRSPLRGRRSAGPPPIARARRTIARGTSWRSVSASSDALALAGVRAIPTFDANERAARRDRSSRGVPEERSPRSVGSRRGRTGSRSTPNWPTRLHARAMPRLAERDRLLRAWRGDIVPEEIELADAPLESSPRYEWRAYAFVAEKGSFAHELAVAGVFGFPKRRSDPLALGFAARSIDEARAAATREALQQLAFLWGSPIPDAPSPGQDTNGVGFHLDTYQAAANRPRLRSWLDGAHRVYATRRAARRLGVVVARVSGSSI